MFAKRCGHEEGLKHWHTDIAPVFLQFLECVAVLMRQQPSFFEFNEQLLILLADEVYLCRFGTFLCNSERERELIEVI